MSDVTQVVGKEIARLFTERFGDPDEVLEVQAALIRFQPGQLRGGDPYTSRDRGLTAASRFTKLPEDSTVQDVLGNLEIASGGGHFDSLSAARNVLARSVRSKGFWRKCQPRSL